MLMQPALHIVITADEETIRTICTTVGLVVSLFVMLKGLAILKDRKQ